MPPVAGEQTQPGAVIQRIAELRQLDSMQQLPDAELVVLAQCVVLRMFEPQSIIVAEHSVAQHLFVIITGHHEQSMYDGNGSLVTLALLGRGDVFGEGGLFGLQQRRTTVRATARSAVLQIAYTDLVAQRDQLPNFFKLLRTRFRERLLHITLARVAVLTTLTPMERLLLAEQIDDVQVDRGTTIVEHGAISREIYIVAEGQVLVKQDQHILAVLQPGDVIGEMALVEHTAHDVSVIAFTPLHLLVIPRATFEQFLDQRPDIAHGLRELAAQRKQIDRTPQHIATTEQLVATGVIRGSMALARHPELCDPHCHRCEDACADRFTVARLHFSGTTVNNVEMADMCRHCQWGAECAEVCPEHAFRWDQSGHLVVTDRCTGCGDCISACPYESINQVPFQPQATGNLAWLLQKFSKPQPIVLRANKCDACHGYNDHACVEACPTGALQWIPVEDLYPVSAAPAHSPA